MDRTWTVGALAACAAAVAPASAPAAVTIGGDVNVSTQTAITCEAGTSCTHAQIEPTFSPPVQTVLSPIDGVITRWRVVGSGTIRLQVLDYSGGSASATATSQPATALDGGANPVRLRIAEGQIVGAELPSNASGLRFLSADGRGTTMVWQPAVGATGQSFLTGALHRSLLLNADVEADVDADGFGDESQDQCSANAATQGLCNDMFADAVAIAGSDATVAANTRGASREPFEPDHCEAATGPAQDCGLWIGAHSVWYRWTAPASGPATLDTCQAAIDSILAVYTGAALGELVRVADDNNGCLPDTFGSRVTFDAVEGTTYRFAVGDAGGAQQNDFTLRLDGPAPEPPPPPPPPPPKGDTEAPETSITKGPKRKTKRKRARFTFAASEAGSRFECRLDGGEFEPCASPHRLRVRRGRHRFEVRAIDAAGNADSTPAGHRWKVKRKRKRGRR